MRQGYYVNQLLQVIEAYGLQDRYPDEIEPILLAAQYGMMSDAMAKGYLMSIQPMLDELDDHPNFLHRPPREEQLYAEGRPNIEIGNLLEGERQRFGLRIRNRTPHVLAAGATGGGKTTLLRAIIHQVEALNVQHDEQANQPDCD